MGPRPGSAPLSDRDRSDVRPPYIAFGLLTTVAISNAAICGLEDSNSLVLVAITDIAVVPFPGYGVHINNTFAKIGARHRAEAVHYAYRKGIAD